MPKYRVQLKQGKRTIVSHIEAKNVQSVQDFYNTLTTMKVSEILKIEFQDSTTPPIDDYNYQSIFKGFIKNETSRKARQIILHNIKKSKDTNDIYLACKDYLEIENTSVDSLSASLFKD